MVEVRYLLTLSAKKKKTQVYYTLNLVMVRNSNTFHLRDLDGHFQEYQTTYILQRVHTQTLMMKNREKGRVKTTRMQERMKSIILQHPVAHPVDVSSSTSSMSA